MESKLPNSGSPLASRRDFLLGAGLTIGAVALPGSLSQAEEAPAHPHVHDATPVTHPFSFGQDPPRLRKSFFDLTDDEVKQLCAAVGYLRNGIRGNRMLALSVDSPIQWDQYARAHAHHCTEATIDEQVHWSWYFLPWHRGYLFFLERILARVLEKIFKLDAAVVNQFALPYWDWTSHAEIPNTKERTERGLKSPFFGYDLNQQNMVNPDNLLLNQVPFDNLALWNGNRGPTIDKPEMLPNNETDPSSKEHVAATRYYMSVDNIATMLRLPFPMFGGQSTVSAATGQGLLEQDPHNLGHDWVGSRYGSNRDMGTLRYAALDPLFFLHHANIDRIWSLYTNQQPDLNGPWGTKRYPYLDTNDTATDGIWVDVSVAEIVEKMNTVRYAPLVSQFPSAVIAAAPATPRPASKVDEQTLTSKPAVLNAAAVTFDSNLKPEVHALVAQAAAVQENPVAPIPLLEITTGPLKYSAKFSIRVFINQPGATDKTPIENNPNFVGLIRGLDSETRGMADTSVKGHVFSMLLRPAKGKLQDLIQPGKPLQLTLVPIGLRKGSDGLDLEIKELKLKFVH